MILAIWNQALHICHTQAVSGIEGSLRQDINRVKRNISHEGSEKLLSQIQKEFVQEVERAEELAKFVESGTYFLGVTKLLRQPLVSLFRLVRIAKLKYHCR